MYRRVNSGRFIGLTTLLIVVVMAVFTWVMYGMAQQVYIMTDIMVELSDHFATMITIQEGMAVDMDQMSRDMSAMNVSVAAMNGDVSSMNTELSQMTDAMRTMTGAMHYMSSNMDRMTFDMGKVTHAISNPMSYMFGGPFGF